MLTAPLQRGKTPPPTRPPFGCGEAGVWGIWNTPSLFLLSGPLCFRMVVSTVVSSMGQIELFILLGIIIISYSKLHDSVKVICI